MKKMQWIVSAFILTVVIVGVAHAGLVQWRHWKKMAPGQVWVYKTTENSIKNLPGDNGYCFPIKERFNYARVWLNGTGAINTTLQVSQSKMDAAEPIFAFQNANDTHSADFTSDNTQAFTVTNEQGNCFRLRLDFADATNTVTRAQVDFSYNEN